MKNYFDTSINNNSNSIPDEQLHSNNSQFYQRGLGLKKEVQDILKKEYFSNVVESIKANNYTLQAGGITIHLAREFGFCYGVDRAVDYAYQTREKFPDRRIFITGEIIHNPHVNNRLIDMGIHFLSGQYSNGMTHADLQKEDVVILPAFGVSIQEFKRLQDSGCVMVDTTCGSVLNVWKRVTYYAKNDYTSIIHGKYFHEETIATSSQALKYPNGKYLVVKDMKEAKMVCDYIVNGGNKNDFIAYFKNAMSDNFDPDSDLQKIGVANQTTMLSSESLAIAEELKKAMQTKYGETKLDEHFQTFDTICSATQERQDAVLNLVHDFGLDLMLVIGGFNSSNTNHLAVLTSEFTATYHIDDPKCILADGSIRHKKVGGQEMQTTSNWLPTGEFTLGITAGASTPNNKIGEAVEKILLQRDVEIDKLMLNRTIMARL